MATKRDEQAADYRAEYKLRAERITQSLTADRFAAAVTEADTLRARVAELEAQPLAEARRGAAEAALAAAPAASEWRMLKLGEIVQAGDEYLQSDGKWQKISLRHEIRLIDVARFRRRVAAPAASEVPDVVRAMHAIVSADDEDERHAALATLVEAVCPGWVLALAASGGGEQLREKVAAIVHDAMRFEREKSTPRWQAGNSFAESRARQAAKEIAALFTAPAVSGGGEQQSVSFVSSGAQACESGQKRRIEAARLREWLAIFVHAHAIGNSVPPHIVAAARSMLKEVPPGPEGEKPELPTG